ncbi:MAG: aminotransferase class V-fold PLP-dependent enzyme [Chloroflexi bacterium]|nr:aminotransferase class V-fold PLP-dependent enzyme [Chloroflexota bacterium]
MSLRNHFLLDPNVVFLNHGSFGACPRPVFEVYQQWQRQLEHQPVQFLMTRVFDELRVAREVLGRYVNCSADDLAFVTNATSAVNLVARSLPLGVGDEVLATDLEYGACDHTWQFLSQKQGFTYVRQHIPLPATTAEAIVAALWAGVTPRTKVIFVSHITSATALTLPVELICQRAQAAGILTVVDGAHAVGQIPLDMAAINADFYTSNCHKWLCAPKGSAFLYAHPRAQHLIEPLVVSWGWGPTRQYNFGSDFQDYLIWGGTADPSAYLTIPAAIAFQADHNWAEVRQDCHALARHALEQVMELTDERPLYHPTSDFYAQMANLPLPPIADPAALKHRLLDQYRIEIPITQWGGRTFARISVQGYTTAEEVEVLTAALGEILGL